MTVVPYQGDAEAGLADAQAKVFARGEYGFTYKMKTLYESIGEPLPPMPLEPKAATIDEAREIGAESGTCSVLDVYALGPAPAPAVAGPFAPDDLVADIGTLRPTLQEVEAALTHLYERLERGEAAYIVCYAQDEPAHYMFIGMSFD
jgi:hypothetical protein